MRRIYIPSAGPDSWQQFLAEPQKQWRTGYSAKSLAYSWEEAAGFPAEIEAAIRESDVAALDDLQPLLVIPEHKVPLPGGSTQSQNDAFVLASCTRGLVAMTIEGKVEESFDKTIAQWGPDNSRGKRKRFDYLVELLGLKEDEMSGIYYQLLHRTASAVIEAQRFHAGQAIMLVHSFSQSHSWFPEFAEFVTLFDVQVERNQLYFCGTRSSIDLYIGWVTGNPEYLSR